MSRDILSEYGPESHQPQAARATCGGVKEAKPTSYSPPQGPTSINSPQRPGIGGTNHGNCGSQGKR